MRGLRYYTRLLRWTAHHYLPEHDVPVQTANGKLSVSSRDWLIGKHLFVHRNYELDFIDTSVQFLRSLGYLTAGKNRTVLDIGANLGMIGIGLVRHGYFENVLAFEPDPRNYRLLETNVRQNGLLDRIDCFNAALTSSNGEIPFELSDANSGDSRVRHTVGGGELKEHLRNTVNVAGVTLDSFMNERREVEDKVDLLWVDIQGHEGHLFAGAKGFFLKRRIPVINEFWGYGIARSGVSRDEYCSTVTGIFSELFILTADGYEARPIERIDELFDVYSRPREIANIILV